MIKLEIPKDSLFGLENLPYGVFSTPGTDPRVGVRVHEHVVDLAVILGDDTFAHHTLNPFMQQGRQRWIEVRQGIQSAISEGVPEHALFPLTEVTMHMPFEVGDYVDFYASENHATNLGKLFRPEQEPLTPNWKWLPIGYHGRSQTVVLTGTDIVRPQGQYRGDPNPEYGPEQRLDIECELGFVVGTASDLGRPVQPEEFDDYVFGVVIFNDWSARSIQAWEYVPLGPHLGKSFASTISAWVTPMLALDNARINTPEQGEQLEYLHMEKPWGLDINCEVQWNGQVVSRPPYATTFWSPAQLLAQVTANGASTSTGDMMVSGTISGVDVDQRGAFIELTWNGKDPISVNGEQRSFLEDGDEIVISGTAPGKNGQTIGFGECRGRILPAL